MNQSARDDFTQRYSPQRPRTRWRSPWVIGVGAVLLVAIVAWMVSVVGRFHDDRVSFQNVGFFVAADGTSVDVQFYVVKQANMTAVCQLEALNAQFSVVGLVQTDVGPNVPSNQLQRVTIPTQERAVTGIVKTCTPAAQ